MSLQSLKEKYKKGEITKSDFIDSMYSNHNLLFEYIELLKNTNVSSIEITDQGVVATFRDSGIKFTCIPGDKRLAPLDTLNFSEYEKVELEMQLQLIEPADIIIDIGANLGWYSMHVANKFPKCKIHAFEPIPRTFEYLNKNISLNKINNIETIQMGLSDKESEMELFFDPDLSVNASLKNVSDSPNVQKITCKITTLDNYCEQNKINVVDFIKCDVEGAELFSLRGATKILSNSKPIIFCEMLRKWAAKFDYHPNDIIKLMKSHGYKCYSIYKQKLKEVAEVSEETKDTNFLFLHIEKHAEKISALII